MKPNSILVKLLPDRQKGLTLKELNQIQVEVWLIVEGILNLIRTIIPHKKLWVKIHHYKFLKVLMLIKFRFGKRLKILLKKGWWARKKKTVLELVWQYRSLKGFRIKNRKIMWGIHCILVCPVLVTTFQIIKVLRMKVNSLMLPYLIKNNIKLQKMMKLSNQVI